MYSQKNLLFELGTEELPPVNLNKIADTFLYNIVQEIEAINLTYISTKNFVSPRRIAILIQGLQTIKKANPIEKIGPFMTSIYDDQGFPKQSAIGFAKSCKTKLENLSIIKYDKDSRLVYKAKGTDSKTENIIPDIIKSSLKKISIENNTMRWGSENFSFIRPVRWIVLMFGSNIIKLELFGCTSGNRTFGHRFLTHKPISIKHPESYEKLMENVGYVIPDWNKRKKMLQIQLEEAAQKNNSVVLINKNLLEKVNSMVEKPYVLHCYFDEMFLDIPKEILISVMENYQTCFALFNDKKEIRNSFLVVSNIGNQNSQKIIMDNKRVMTARLSDALFFYKNDTSKKIEFFIEKSKLIKFHENLGSMYEKAQRVANISAKVARLIKTDETDCYRAGILSKCDLTTYIVQEFSDLQGVMGKYLAKKNNEKLDVAIAIEQQYWPLFSGDKLPNIRTAQILSLAEKIDTLIGIFISGYKPTGDSDPFALRRVSIGILRIIKECNFDISLSSIIEFSIKEYNYCSSLSLKSKILKFLEERLKYIYRSENISSEYFNMIDIKHIDNVVDFNERIKALTLFKKTNDFVHLVQVNKRVKNILRKNKIVDKEIVLDQSKFTSKYEHLLHSAILEKEELIKKIISEKSYRRVFLILVKLTISVEDFFKHVMVIDKNEEIRINRILLLQKFHFLYNQDFNFSKLQES